MTRIHPAWPPITPWAALWLAGLSAAILLQSGHPPPPRVWAGRAITALVAGTTLTVVVGYGTGRLLEIDRIWFGYTLGEMHSDYPGRPAVSTAVATFLLSCAVAFTLVEQRAARSVWLACLAAGAATPWVAVLAYLLDSMDLVEAGEAAGMAMATALGLLLLAWATLLTRPDRNPVSWFLAQPNRVGLIRLGFVFVGFPFIVALARYAFLILGSDPDTALAQSAVVGIVIAAGIGFGLVGREQRLLADVAADRTLLRATLDGMLDPQALLEAIRDPAGRVIDFRYLMVNSAACAYLGVPETHLVGCNLLQLSPGIGGSDIFGRYVQCLADGEPLILSGWPHYSEFLATARYYDIRATRAGPDLLILSWTDVTGRVDNARLLAASERRYRLLAENAADVVCHVRDGTWVWVSPSIESVLDAPAEHWRGRSVGEVVLPEDFAANAEKLATVVEGGEIQERIRVVSVGGTIHWLDVHAKPFYDEDGRQDGVTAILRVVDDQVSAEEAAATAQRLQASADARYRRLINESVIPTSLNTVDGRFVLVNQAMCDFFGYDANTLLEKTWQELTAPEYLDEGRAAVEDILAGRRDAYRTTKQYIHADGHRIWGDLSLSRLTNSDGDVEHVIRQIADITADVEMRDQLEQARRLQAAADARYRRSMDNAAIGMALITGEGRFEEVNEALCRLFGYDAETLKKKTWQELTAPDYLDADLRKVGAVLDGRIESYRMLKQYVHADGHLIWGDLSVSCVRDVHGRVEHFISQIADITAAVEANERNALLNQRITAELEAAAAYVQSILPAGLTGDVRVSSRYLPSQELGGDCFDYSWIDDDHLMAYLIDVSGHGIEPALLAVSLQNMLRSRAFTTETLLVPEEVLCELNQHFQMEQHGEHYFTMWYGVYERSTRMMRYANAGAPTAYAFNTGADGHTTATELPSNSLPVGAFPDTRFQTDSYAVPPGCRMLIYSDGASEQVLADGSHLSSTNFKDLTSRLAASSDWSIDDLVDELRSLTPGGFFEDDFSLIQLTFD
ncbi:MAG: PAS domain S-box protein [Mycobacterium sp.]|nr:PAS domain S-box protein [Mycobacterium sp.]